MSSDIRNGETCRADGRLHRSEYIFWRNPSRYYMETGYVHYKPGQCLMCSRKVEDYTMYRSKQGLIDEEIRDIIKGYGDYNDFRNYERFMSTEEKIKAVKGLDKEDRCQVIDAAIKDILNGCGDFRDFSIYKKYMTDEQIVKCLEAFDEYY